MILPRDGKSLAPHHLGTHLATSPQILTRDLGRGLGLEKPSSFDGRALD